MILGGKKMSLVSTMVLTADNLNELSQKLNKELLRYNGKEIFDIKFISDKEAVIIFRN